MKLVLLPGLDGTGELFTPLINQLDSSIETQIITYDLNTKQTYDELTQYVLSNLPKEEFVLLAESFSGPIAYQVASIRPKELKSLIIVASFLERPKPTLLKLLTLMPSKLLTLPLPTFIIRFFFLGFIVKSEIILLFKMSIRKVSSGVIHFRLKELLKLRFEDCYKKIHMPTIYIQATDDKLVSSTAFNDWEVVSKNIQLFQVQGEHFILQSNPVKCAEIIRQVMHAATNDK